MTVVVGGWVRMSPLSPLVPESQSMPFDAAIGILLAGAALLVSSFGRGRLSGGLAILPILIGAATLAQRALSVVRGIDRFPIESDVGAQAGHAMRMSPITAGCLFLIGVAVLLHRNRANSRAAHAATGLLSSLVLGLGLARIVNYLEGAETPPWLDMTVHAGIGFTALGAGALVLAIWAAGRSQDSYVWIPLAPVVTLPIVVWSLWGGLVSQEARQTRLRLATEARMMSEGIGALFRPRFQSLERLAARWTRDDRTPEEAWRADVGLYVDHQPGLWAVAWVDLEPKLQRFIVAPSGTPDSREPTTAEQGQRLVEAWETAREAAARSRGVGISATVDLGPERGSTFLVALPVNRRDGGADGHVVAIYQWERSLESLNSNADTDGLVFAVEEGGQTIYLSRDLDEARSEWSAVDRLPVGEADWAVRVWPDSSWLREARSPVPPIALSVGLVLSALVSLTVHLAVVNRRRALLAEFTSQRLEIEAHERLRAEEDLRRLNADLEHRVRERTAEDDRRTRQAERAESLTREYARRLERSNEELQQFAYVASHDLQEPLRMVASFTQLLADRYHGALDSEATKWIEYAVDGAKRMQQLITDLLEYSRVQTKGGEFVPVDLDLALAGALENLTVRIEESGAEVAHDPMPTVDADAIQMVQLFQNLIGNAIKFSSANGRRPVVRVGAERTDREWVLSVTDNGIGVEPEFGDRIFVIFQRLHGREEYAGTGIGLAICKSIVERHGGRIWVESKTGEGATFCFTFPVGDRT